jgi:hypothetical protein
MMVALDLHLRMPRFFMRRLITRSHLSAGGHCLPDSPETCLTLMGLNPGMLV